MFGSCGGGCPLRRQTGTSAILTACCSLLNPLLSLPSLIVHNSELVFSHVHKVPFYPSRCCPRRSSHRFFTVPQNPVVESAALVMASVSTAHPSGSLQIPSMGSTPGSSRNYSQAPPSSQSGPSTSRPISVAAHGATSQNPPPSASASRRQRASHSVVSPTSGSQQQGNSNSQHDDTTPPYADVYSHSAAVAYAAAHPRRTIPKFGPYLLLQTLGEGEFGKVKLGLHNQWGEEVAVKLIRRGNVDTTVRMSKVEREIEVLKVLPFPFT